MVNNKNQLDRHLPNIFSHSTVLLRFFDSPKHLQPLFSTIHRLDSNLGDNLWREATWLNSSTISATLPSESRLPWSLAAWQIWSTTYVVGLASITYCSGGRQTA